MVDGGGERGKVLGVMACQSASERGEEGPVYSGWREKRVGMSPTGVVVSGCRVYLGERGDERGAMARPGRAGFPDVRGVGKSMRTSPSTVAIRRNSSIRTDRKMRPWLVSSFLIK